MKSNDTDKLPGKRSIPDISSESIDVFDSPVIFLGINKDHHILSRQFDMYTYGFLASSTSYFGFQGSIYGAVILMRY